MATREERMLQYEHDFMLVVDNNQKALSRMIALAIEVRNRKHGDQSKMADELDRRCRAQLKPVLTREEYITISAGEGITRPGWCRILDHYVTKYAEGVR